MRINHKRKLYLRLCNKADKILIKSGVRKICIECSITKPFRKDYPYLGCCEGCRYLTSDGCSTKSLTCKLWLCSDMLIEKIKLKGLWKEWEEIKDIARRHNWNFNPRRGIDDCFGVT